MAKFIKSYDKKVRVFMYLWAKTKQTLCYDSKDWNGTYKSR